MAKKSSLAERLIIFGAFIVFAGLIVVFSLSQTPRAVDDTDNVSNFDYNTSSKSETGDTSSIENVSKININSATVEQLDALPGIGPSKAKAIIDYRTKNGPFSNVDELNNVDGIGEVTFGKLKDLVTVE